MTKYLVLIYLVLDKSTLDINDNLTIINKVRSKTIY